MLSLGRFNVDTERKLLLCDGEEVAIEAKAMDVLLYLIENSDRYVPLEELHQQVWKDRVVTDSAVRQTIAKLRKVFGNEAEQIVKSAPKKGYRLIGFESPSNSTNNLKIIKKPTHLRKYISMSLLLIVVIFLASQTITESKRIELQEGSNISFTVGDNGGVYYIQKMLSGGFDLYLKLGPVNSKLHSFTEHVSFPVSVNGNVYLAWQSQSGCGYYRISESNFNAIDKVYLESCSSISNLSAGSDNAIITWNNELNGDLFVDKLDCDTECRLFTMENTNGSVFSLFDGDYLYVVDVGRTQFEVSKYQPSSTPHLISRISRPGVPTQVKLANGLINILVDYQVEKYRSDLSLAEDVDFSLHMASLGSVIDFFGVNDKYYLLLNGSNTDKKLVKIGITNVKQGGRPEDFSEINLSNEVFDYIGEVITNSYYVSKTVKGAYFNYYFYKIKSTLSEEVIYKSNHEINLLGLIDDLLMINDGGKIIVLSSEGQVQWEAPLEGSYVRGWCVESNCKILTKDSDAFYVQELEISRTRSILNPSKVGVAEAKDRLPVSVISKIFPDVVGLKDLAISYVYDFFSYKNSFYYTVSENGYYVLYYCDENGLNQRIDQNNSGFSIKVDSKGGLYYYKPVGNESVLREFSVVY